MATLQNQWGVHLSEVLRPFSKSFLQQWGSGPVREARCEETAGSLWEPRLLLAWGGNLGDIWIVVGLAVGVCMPVCMCVCVHICDIASPPVPSPASPVTVLEMLQSLLLAERTHLLYEQLACMQEETGVR